MKDVLLGKPESKIEFKPKVFECMRSKMELCSLDGCLDKPFWAQTRFSEEFEDILWNKNSKKPYKATRVKMLYDDNALYIGAYLYDDRLWATTSDSDVAAMTDNGFEIFLDPDGDGHNYHSVTVTPLNILQNVVMTRPPRNGGEKITAPLREGGVQTAVHIDGNLNDPSSMPLNRGWSVEIKIPWKFVLGENTHLSDGASSDKTVNAFKSPEFFTDAPVAGEVWRANFSRIDWLTEISDDGYEKVIDPEKGKGYIFDRWVWSPIGMGDMHMPELWGYIHFQNDENTLPSYTPDTEEYTKWLMWKLYYRQKYYYADKKQYASDYGAICGGWAEVNADVSLGKGTFNASTVTPDGRRVTVFSDGLITVQ